MNIPRLARSLGIWLLLNLFILTILPGCDCDDDSTAIPKPHATFTNLGFLQGDVRSEATAVSWDGSVVVGTSMQSDSSFFLPGKKAFRWNALEGMIELGFLQGGTYSEAKDISDDGSIVLGGGDNSSGFRVAFLWSDSTGFTSLSNLSGSTLCVAGGVSGDGTVIVGTCLTINNEAFRWTESTGTISLGQFGTGSSASSTATAVSSNGETIVGLGWVTQAIMWTSNGIIALVNDVSAESAAYAVSENGSVVVGYVNDKAFRWTQQSGILAINEPTSGISSSIASGVSGDGQRIVGWGTTSDGDAAFLWDAVHGMRQLEVLLSSDYVVDITGWKLTHATAISGDGRTIVGYGTNPGGQTEGWVLQLPN